MTTVARKNGMQVESPTSIQSHMDSIHSPHRTRKTIMNECIKSMKCQRGSSLSGNRSTLSVTYFNFGLRNSFATSFQMSKSRPCGRALTYRYNFCQRAACPWRRKWRWWCTRRTSSYPKRPPFFPWWKWASWASAKISPIWILATEI